MKFVSRGTAGRVVFALIIQSLASAALAQDPATPPAAAAATSPATTTPEARPRLIPSATFAKLPAMRGFRISPDGKRLLVRADVKGEARLAIVEIFGNTPPKVFGMPPKTELAYYRWAGNDRVLISVAQTVPWFGDEARATRLLAHDIPTGQTIALGRKLQGLEGDDLLYTDPAGAYALISQQKTIYDYPAVYRVDLGTGDTQQIVSQKTNIYEWYADNKGVVRMGLGYFGKSYRVIYRAKETDDFRVVAKPRMDDEEAFYDIVRIYGDTDQGYVLSNKQSDRYALYKVNLATREIGEKVYENATNDIDDFDTNDDGSGLLYASYTDDRSRIHWFDEAFRKLQETIDGGLKDRQNAMLSWDKGKTIIMVWTGDSNDPGRYYLFRPEEGVLNRYFVPYPDLRPIDLAKSQYITYTARDGTAIPAYLTLPKGRDAKGLPLVILPHGGPFGVRDELGFDTEVQFLVNRGYAVLQPNFRGSGGYGKAFSDKGYGQWGRTMQDDLDDGMDWLAKQGTIDPKRVCLVGSSYGGYAALWGAIRNPERYRCAASFAGVTDLRKQLDYQLDFFIAKKYQKDWRDKVRGVAEFDLTSVSPVQQAARLQVPVLIAHGEDDTNVPYKQGKWMAEALKKAGKSFEFYSYADEGHGFDKPENLQSWLDRLEAFLAKHNPS